MSTDKAQGRLFYKLDEISRLAKLDPNIIETWEKEFPFIRPGLTGGGKKIFRQKDLDIILRIKELTDKQNFTLAGAKRKIEEEFGFQPAQPLHPDKLRKALWQVRDQLKEISETLQKRSKKA